MTVRTSKRPSLEEQYRRLATIWAPEAGQLPGTDALDPNDFDPGGLRQAVIALKAGADPELVKKGFKSDDLLAIMGQAPDQDPQEAIRAGLAQRWQVIGCDSLLQPPKPPDYLVDRMIRRPALLCVFGSPGSLKTMVMMDLAVCVASGQPWLDPLPNVGSGGSYRINQSPVLWLDLDNGQDRLQERFGALLRGRGIANAPLHAISLPRPPFDASEELDADLLSAQIRDLGARLCIIDNLGTISGGRDENSSEMVAVMANLRYVAESTGATIIVIHHRRKTINEDGRRGDLLRGHSSIEASLDLALLVMREEGSDELRLQSTKTRDNPVKPFVCRWTYDSDPVTGALLTARFWHCANCAPKQAEHVELAQKLPDLVESMGVAPNQSALVQAIEEQHGKERKCALAAIKWSVSHGLLLEERKGEGKTAPLLYRLPARAAYRAQAKELFEDDTE